MALGGLQMQAGGMLQRLWVLVSHGSSLTPIRGTRQGRRDLGNEFLHPVSGCPLIFRPWFHALRRSARRQWTKQEGAGRSV